jgi:hypothetical protein
MAASQVFPKTEERSDEVLGKTWLLVPFSEKRERKYI